MPTGNGLAMRAFRVLQALSHRYGVSLMAPPPPKSAKANDAQNLVRALCRSVTLLPAGRRRVDVLWRRLLRWLYADAYFACYRQPSDWRVVSAADRRALANAYADECFDLIHVHRLYMLPVLSSLPAHLAGVPAQIDIDDVESSTRERLAALANLNGDLRLARMMSRDADLYRSIEIHDLPRFQRTFVCATGDRQLLPGGKGRPPIDVIPNIVAIPERGRERLSGTPFVFLFVGSIDYYPNLDAVVFFCRDIAPAIRRRTTSPFEIRLVASGRERQWSRVPKIPELVRCEQSDDAVTAEYAKADAVVVPIRAGGGTRIKALEAFANRKPVVATSIGAEGLDVRAGEHVLIADTPEDFAAQCLRLMQDSAVRCDLAERAFALVSRSYGTEALRRHLDAIEGLANEAP